MVDNLAAVTKANYICNDLGLDTMTMGATIACAMELFDRGYLTERQAGGPIKWGDGRRLVELVKLTGYREGFGNELAEGSYRLAERYGHPELAMVSKRLELPGYDPRGLQGMGLNYATSPIGGSHCRAHMAYCEMVGIPKLIDPHEWKGKARIVKILAGCIQRHRLGRSLYFFHSAESSATRIGDLSGWHPGIFECRDRCWLYHG